ncbi:hypothetical protein [Vibrio cincinnatiensis]|uniref:hypothetical protein n=1 Tax=Vibrio cincinnatiensis TaxID=675 RepID=UPI001EDF6B02|nr:hypothetical protein [Vibrio cincinnatiensis]MCG3723697.1 hypothetical protein [Vibrio cincinnatiensis]
MTQTLKRVSAKIATLHKRDVIWLMKRLPSHLAVEIETYTKEFSQLIKREKSTLIDEIDMHFFDGYKKAQAKKKRLDVLIDMFASISEEAAEQLALELPECICNELISKHKFSYLIERKGVASSHMSPYVKEKVLQMMLNNRD